MAQCSVLTTNTAGCYAYNDQASDQTFYIPIGIPVRISTYFNVSAQGYQGIDTGAEADLGSQMWFTSTSGVGSFVDGTTFTAAENTDGRLYLALGSTPGGSGHIAASW